MAWTERQLAMLEAIGLPAWLPRAATAGQRAPGAPGDDTAPAGPVADASDGATRPPKRGTEPNALAAGASGPLASLDWDGLRAAVAACQACELCRTRRQTVFGVGSRDAQWMVVGEAPGEQEDLRGEPFVGAAGHLLDRMLHALGLTRAEAQATDTAVPPQRRVYIANTLKCRPPRNRNPDPTELARCEPYLIRQVELLRPRMILAMGRFAVQALLRSDEAIGRLRGRVHQYQGVPLVVTYHPAYLLRNPADKAKAWADLCLAAATLESNRS